MKKLLYPIIGFIMLCISITQTDNRRIEKQGADNLVLKPFDMFGLLWSCSPEEDPEKIIDDPENDSVNGGAGGGSDVNHSSHYSQYHSSHSSHYSSSHRSHQSHSSHSSHYSSR